jgi:hypothetical protein
MEPKFSEWLSAADSWLMALGAVLAADVTSTTLMILASMCLLGVLSRSVPHALACILAALLTLVLARQGQAGLAMLMAGLSCTIALLGFSSSRHRQQLSVLDRRLQRMHEETDAFLSALDNRARDLERRMHSPVDKT